MAVIYLTNSYF